METNNIVTVYNINRFLIHSFIRISYGQTHEIPVRNYISLKAELAEVRTDSYVVWNTINNKLW